MKQHLLILFLLSSVVTSAQDIIRVTAAEYNRHNTRNNQVFETIALSPEEHLQIVDHYYNEVLSQEEKRLVDAEELSLQAGVFLPSSIKAVYVHYPQYGKSHLFLNGMNIDLYCDVYALSSEGLLATGTTNDETFQSYLSVYSIQGWELLPAFQLEYNVTPYDFRWAADGWLYFRGGYDYYKIRITPPPHRENCLMEDLAISHQEFLAAKAQQKRYNVDRYDRLPSGADTSLILSLSKGDVILQQMLWGDCLFGQFGEGGPSFVEIVQGDYCFTRLLADTTDMQSCSMMLSRDNYFAGINTEWGAGSNEVPAFIYVYPYPDDSRHVSAPYIYQATPAWIPLGTDFFWGADGWLYVDGWNWRTSQSCYHKVRLPATIRNARKAR